MAVKLPVTSIVQTTVFDISTVLHYTSEGFDGSFKYSHEVICWQLLKHNHSTSAQQCRVNMERGVFGRRTNHCDCAILNMGKKCILECITNRNMKLLVIRICASNDPCRETDYIGGAEWAMAENRAQVVVRLGQNQPHHNRDGFTVRVHTPPTHGKGGCTRGACRPFF